MPSIKTLLCPVDFSQMSRAVLDYAVFMAQSHQAQLKLIHVVDQLHGFDSYKILHMTAIEITHEMERQARTQLKELVATLPIPATFVVGQDGHIKARFVDPDYRNRMAIEDLIAALK